MLCLVEIIKRNSYNENISCIELIYTVSSTLHFMITNFY